MFKSILKSCWKTIDKASYIERKLRPHVYEFESWDNVKAAFQWQQDPVLDSEYLDQYQFITDINGRRYRDAELVAGTCANVRTGTFLEIGTSHGNTTALMSQNAPDANIYTVNLPPDDEVYAGKHITHRLPVDKIGAAYRERGCVNVKQILANTSHWKPDFPINLAFIDGCHDTDFVYNDTRIVVDQCEPDAWIIWHDFSMQHLYHHRWILSVGEALSRLIDDGVIVPPIYHLRNSWCAICRLSHK